MIDTQVTPKPPSNTSGFNTMIDREQYRKLRKRNLPAMACVHDYNGLIQRGLVLCIQDSMPTVLDYPTAYARKLTTEWRSVAIACEAIDNRTRTSRKWLTR